MKEEDMEKIAGIIANVLNDHQNEENISEAKNKALDLCEQFPLPY
jgi:glycine/serine hydroxymethyltransferase